MSPFVTLALLGCISSGYFVDRSKGADVRTFRCLTCSFSNYAPGRRLCLDDTSRVRSTVSCNSTVACLHYETINKKTGAVSSVFRTCGVDPGIRGCQEDWTNKNCVQVCRSDMCNNATGLWSFHTHSGQGSLQTGLMTMLPALLLQYFV